MTYLIRSSFKRRVVSLVDSIGNLIFGKRNDYPSDTAKSILLIRLDHLGDVLLTTPAIRSLKKQFPQARITMVIKEWSFEAIKYNPHIDNIVIFNSFWTIASREGTETEGVAGIYQLIRQLRKEHFDFAIDFKGDIRNIIIAYLSGAKRRISYSIRGGGFLLTDVVPYESEIHEINKNLKLLTPLGINSEESKMELYFTDEDMARVKQIFDQKGIDLNRRTIALHYGGASQFKRWDLEKFISLAERITENNSTNVVIFGGPYEREAFRSAENPEKEIFLMPDLTVCHMAAAFKRCALLVCNDSGPMHVGFAVGTPTVAIFGPTFPNRFGPQDLEKNRIVRSQLSCSPCWHPDKAIGCRERNCLNSIDVGSVLAAINELSPLSVDH
ncbi:MAG: glycosyltransferase family 9 protein [Candidatus Hodarchaeota archaeon]